MFGQIDPKTLAPTNNCDPQISGPAFVRNPFRSRRRRCRKTHPRHEIFPEPPNRNSRTCQSFFRNCKPACYSEIGRISIRSPPERRPRIWPTWTPDFRAYFLAGTLSKAADVEVEKHVEKKSRGAHSCRNTGIRIPGLADFFEKDRKSACRPEIGRFGGNSVAASQLLAKTPSDFRISNPAVGRKPLRNRQR